VCIGLARPGQPLDALMMSSMASIAETDSNGAYKLENIPPGGTTLSQDV
jgi:hypothetical protein